MNLHRRPSNNAKQLQAEVFAKAEAMLDKIDDESRDFTATEQREYNQLLSRIENLEKQKSLEKTTPWCLRPGTRKTGRWHSLGLPLKVLKSCLA